MDLLDLLKLMFRRWYVTTPIIVLTLGAAYGIGISIQPEYKTSVAIVLVPPTTSVAEPEPGAEPRPGNPWLRVGEAPMAQAVQIATSAHDDRSRVEAAGGDPDYEVNLVTRSSILTVEISAATQAQAQATVTAVTELINDEVAEQQAPYQPRSGEQITTQILDAGRNITPSRSNVLRLQIVMITIGLLLAAALTVMFDAIARRRAARIRSRQGSHRPAAPTSGQASVESGSGPEERSNSAEPVPAGHTPGPPRRSAERSRAAQPDDTTLLAAVPATGEEHRK